MSNKNHTQQDPEVQIEAALSKSEQFLEKNSKKLLFALIAIVLLALIIFGYRQFIKVPSEKKALDQSFVAQQFFALDSMNLALNGDGKSMGFLEIASQFGSTEVGNSANHYAGICYLKMGEYEKAIASLKKYSPVEGLSAQIINAQNIGLIGDCYTQLKDYKNAVDHYLKASKIENNFTAPLYLKKAGLVSFAQGDSNKALECYQIIKIKYFNSLEAQDIDKYIGQCIK